MATVKQTKKLVNCTTAGITLQTASPAYANNQAACGWDWLIIDTVNAALGQRDVYNILTAIGVIVPHICNSVDAVMARSTTLYPSAPSEVPGTRSFIGPVRAHNKLGFIPGWINADASFFVARQLEEAPQAMWESILACDFHVAVLDIPNLCAKLGMYDTLFAAPPQDDALPARLAKFHAVYAEPVGALLAALTTFVKLCAAAGKTPGVLLGEAQAGPAYAALGFKFIGAGSDFNVLMTSGDAAIAKQRRGQKTGRRCSEKPAPGCMLLAALKCADVLPCDPQAGRE